MSAAPLAAVLAGGRSRRFGAPKALAPLGGEPLVARVVRAARSAGLETVVVAKAGSPLPGGVGPVWEEPDAPSHPLTGLVAAVERADGRPVVALACDMPFVPPGLVARLARVDADAVAVRVGGHVNPFPGRYTAAALPVLRATLQREAPVQEALAALDARVLAEEDLRELGDPAVLLTGINTPADLAAAEERLGSG